MLRSLIFVIAWLVPSAAHAYIGLGAGISAIGSLLALIAAVLLAIVGFVWYPVKRIRKNRRKAHTEVADKARPGDGRNNGQASTPALGPRANCRNIAFALRASFSARATCGCSGSRIRPSLVMRDPHWQRPRLLASWPLRTSGSGGGDGSWSERGETRCARP